MAGTAFTLDPAHPVQRAALTPVVTQIANTVTDLEVLRVAVEACVVLCTELRTDHATNKTMTDELHIDVDLNGAALEAILTKLDNDAGITDTTYVSIHGRAGSGVSIQAAAVTATDVAAITAVAPSATNTNAASDMITSSLSLS